MNEIISEFVRVSQQLGLDLKPGSSLAGYEEGSQRAGARAVAGVVERKMRRVGKKAWMFD